MKVVSDHKNFEGVNLELVRRKILKQKNKLKRERAKNRKNYIREKKTAIYFPPVSNEQDEELKKQRNRISAQMSRDRKK